MSLICQPTSEDIKRHFITACANGVSSVPPTFHISDRLDQCGYPLLISTPVYWHSHAVVEHFPTVTPNACPRQKQPAAVCTIKRLRRAITACERAQYVSRVFGAELNLCCCCFGGVPHFFSTRPKKKKKKNLLRRVSFTSAEICVCVDNSHACSNDMALYTSGTHTHNVASLVVADVIPPTLPRTNSPKPQHNKDYPFRPFNNYTILPTTRKIHSIHTRDLTKAYIQSFTRNT